MLVHPFYRHFRDLLTVGLQKPLLDPPGWTMAGPLGNQMAGLGGDPVSWLEIPVA